MNRKITIVMLLWVALLLVPSVHAQRKPNPKAYDPDQKRDQEMDDLKAQFLEAYKRAGWPRLYFYSTLESLAANQAEAMDDSVILTHMHARFWDHFADPDVDLVNAAEQQIRNNEVRVAFNNNDMQLAGALLGDEVEADIVIMLRIVELQNRADGAKYSCSYWVTNRNRGETIGSHPWFMYPGKGAAGGDFSAARISEYARLAAMRAMKDVIRAFPGGDGGAGRKFTLEFAGIPDGSMRDVRDAIRDVPGIGTVYRSRLKRGGGTTRATVDVKYAGDPLDLAYDVAMGIEESLDLDASFASVDEGVIAFDVRPVTQESLLSGGPTTPQNKRLRDQFMAAYASAGRPRIGVMVNQAAQPPMPLVSELVEARRAAMEGTQLDEEVEEVEEVEQVVEDAASAGGGETDAPPHSESGAGGARNHASVDQDVSGVTQSQGGTSVIVQPRITLAVGSAIIEEDAIDDDDHRKKHDEDRERRREEKRARELAKAQRDEMLDTMAVEQGLLTRLSALGLSCVDLQQAQRILEQDKIIVGKVYDEMELLRQLSLKENFEVGVSGAGYVERDKKRTQILYSFRAYLLDDATYLGGATVRRDVSDSFEEIGAAAEEIAAEVTGRLAVQLLDKWSGAKTLQVRVSNCPSDRALDAVRTIIEERIPGVISTTFRGRVTLEGGSMGVFEVMYSTSFDELKSEILKARDLPFDLDSKVSLPGRLELRLTSLSAP